MCIRDRFMKIQRNHISEQTVPLIKTIEKVTLPAVRTVHVVATDFDGSTHWMTCLRQFEAGSCVNNNLTERDKAVSLVLVLKGPATEILQTVLLDS